MRPASRAASFVHARQLAAHRRFGAQSQRAQDLRRHLDGRANARSRVDRDHAGLVDEPVRQRIGRDELSETASHQAFYRDDRVAWIVDLMRACGPADLGFAGRQVAHDRRQQRFTVRIGQHARKRALHGRDERVRRAEVDAGGEPVLMRRGGQAGFGDLQKGHVGVPFGRFEGRARSYARRA